MLELSSYGWKAKPSMIGVVRPEARYALPRSRMNAVGECVGRMPGTSPPRGETAPPSTVTAGAAAFTVS